jgi:hypothetical protein
MVKTFNGDMGEDFCFGCFASLTSADFDAGQCTQCGTTVLSKIRTGDSEELQEFVNATETHEPGCECPTCMTVYKLTH